MFPFYCKYHGAHKNKEKDKLKLKRTKQKSFKGRTNGVLLGLTKSKQRKYLNSSGGQQYKHSETQIKKMYVVD